MLGPYFSICADATRGSGGAVQFASDLTGFWELASKHRLRRRTSYARTFTRRYLKTLARHQATHSAVIHPAMTGFERQVLALQSEKVP